MPETPHSTTPADALILPPQSRLQQKASERPDARAQSADLLRRLSIRPAAKDGGIKKAGSPPQRRRTRCVGSPSRARTCDTWINSPPLYRLSYQGIKLARFAWNRPRRFFAAGNRSARSLRPTVKSFGSPSRARTCDTWINSPPLYRLSYQGTRPRAPKNRNAPQRLKSGFYRTRLRSSREIFVCGQKRRAGSPQPIPRRVNRRLRHSPANPRHRIADDALAPCGMRQRRPGAPTNGFLARLCKGR